MRKRYSGLGVVTVDVSLSGEVYASSGNCQSTVQLANSGGNCVSSEDEKQYEWYGNQN